MSVAWPQMTVKGLSPPGSTENRDPYTESGERRARVFFACARFCKTPMRGFESHRPLTEAVSPQLSAISLTWDAEGSG
jgi:hypothetical protein